MLRDVIEEKHINQENYSKKKLTIKRMRIKFDKKKLKDQTTRDEIKNKIQLEIINVNKTIAIMRRGTESKEKRN
jgi:hypothetical protein